MHFRSAQEHATRKNSPSTFDFDPIRRAPLCTANLRIEILDFGEGLTQAILSLRAGIIMSIGNLQEISSQQILVGMI